MIDPTHKLAITWQAELVGISRAAVYYAPRPAPRRILRFRRGRRAAPEATMGGRKDVEEASSTEKASRWPKNELRVAQSAGIARRKPLGTVLTRGATSTLCEQAGVVFSYKPDRHVIVALVLVALLRASGSVAVEQTSAPAYTGIEEVVHLLVHPTSCLRSVLLGR